MMMKTRLCSLTIPLVLSLLTRCVRANEDTPSFQEVFSRQDWRTLGLMPKPKLSRSRRQVQEFPPCNMVLDTLTLEELQEGLGDLIDNLSGEGTFQNTFLRGLFYDNLRFGVQIRRVCAACSDIPDDLYNNDRFQDVCGEDVYGSDVTYSGLMIVPATADGQAIAPGTHKAMVYTHPTSLDSVPSLDWKSRQVNSVTIWFYLAVSSIQSMVVLAPDYMGYAESAESSFKGYLVRKSYETSFVPLWWKAQCLIKEETNCQSALANAAIVSGYNEGGYSSVVVASILDRLFAVDIILVQSGGASYRLASEALLTAVEDLQDEAFSSDRKHLTALLGSAYSSTYSSIANYQTKQDMLATETRQVIVDTISSPETSFNVTNIVMDMVTKGNPAAAFDADFLVTVQQLLDEGNRDPCRSLGSATLRTLNVDLLCQALLDSDLTETLEQEVHYPVEICQSPDDELISVANLPDLEVNANLVRLNGVTGDHTTAGEYCILSNLNFLATTTKISSYETALLHSDGGCMALGETTPVPTAAPLVRSETMTPTANDDGSSGSRVCFVSMTRWACWNALPILAILL